MTKSIYKQLYEEALIIRKTSLVQENAFDYWRNNHEDPLHGSLVFDTETTGKVFGESTRVKFGNSVIDLPGPRVFGISMCMLLKRKLALVWARDPSPLFDRCCELLGNPGTKTAHNARFDIRVCEESGIPVMGPVDCTLTQARIVWNRRQKFGLKELTKVVAPDYYGYDDVLTRTLTNIKTSYSRAGYPKEYANYSFLPDELISEYAMMDAYITWLLRAALFPHIINEHSRVYTREREVMNIVLGIEKTGMCFDRRRAKKEISVLERKIPKILADLYKLVGRFNPLSPKQLLDIMVNKLKVRKDLLKKRGIKGDAVKLSTAKEMLENVFIDTKTSAKVKQFITLLFELRTANKLVGTYLKPLYRKANANSGIVRFNLNPADTRTSRMTSNNPNLHNAPRPDTGHGNPIRACFTVRAGYTNYYQDYSQMEMWLFALLANEEKMLKVLLSGGDIHSAVAIDIYENDAFDENGVETSVFIEEELTQVRINKQLRQRCKAVNFGIIYGMGFKTLAINIKSSLIEAYDLKKAYLENYPGVCNCIDDLKYQLKKYGYVEDFFGKRYNIPMQEAYKAINALVQGGCAQILKIALIAISAYLDNLPSFNGARFRLLLLIHDEFILEMPNNARYMWPEVIATMQYLASHIKELMERGVVLPVDGQVSEGSWDKKYSLDEELKKEVQEYTRHVYKITKKEKTNIPYSSAG
jgi:DNA polymerase-1